MSFYPSLPYIYSTSISDNHTDHSVTCVGGGERLREREQGESHSVTQTERCGIQPRTRQLLSSRHVLLEVCRQRYALADALPGSQTPTPGRTHPVKMQLDENPAQYIHSCTGCHPNTSWSSETSLLQEKTSPVARSHRESPGSEFDRQVNK